MRALAARFKAERGLSFFQLSLADPAAARLRAAVELPSSQLSMLAIAKNGRHAAMPLDSAAKGEEDRAAGWLEQLLSGSVTLSKPKKWPL